MILQQRSFIDDFLIGAGRALGIFESPAMTEARRRAEKQREEEEAQERIERLTAVQHFERLDKITNRLTAIGVEPPNYIREARNISMQLAADASQPADLGDIGEALRAAAEQAEIFLRGVQTPQGFVTGVEQNQALMRRAIQEFGEDPELLDQSPALQQAIAISQQMGGKSPMQVAEALALAPRIASEIERAKSGRTIVSELNKAAGVVGEAAESKRRRAEAVMLAHRLGEVSLDEVSRQFRDLWPSERDRITTEFNRLGLELRRAETRERLATEALRRETAARLRQMLPRIAGIENDLEIAQFLTTEVSRLDNIDKAIQEQGGVTYEALNVIARAARANPEEVTARIIPLGTVLPQVARWVRDRLNGGHPLPSIVKQLEQPMMLPTGTTSSELDTIAQVRARDENPDLIDKAARGEDLSVDEQAELNGLIQRHREALRIAIYNYVLRNTLGGGTLRPDPQRVDEQAGEQSIMELPIRAHIRSLSEGAQEAQTAEQAAATQRAEQERLALLATPEGLEQLRNEEKSLRDDLNKLISAEGADPEQIIQLKQQADSLSNLIRQADQIRISRTRPFGGGPAGGGPTGTGELPLREPAAAAGRMIRTLFESQTAGVERTMVMGVLMRQGVDANEATRLSGDAAFLSEVRRRVNEGATVEQAVRQTMEERGAAPTE